MPTWLLLLELLGGFVYLLLGGDLLVRGSVAWAEKSSISPLVIGLTVVAFGTSMPELVVAVDAALSGHSGIAIGNVVGSNVANVLLVLGIPALVYPMLSNQAQVGRHAVFMVGVSVVFIALCFAGPLGRLHGAVLLALLVLSFLLTARGGSLVPAVEAREELERVLGLPSRPWMIGFFLVLGVLSLPLGAHLAVHGAVGIARAANVTDAQIGLTVIAIGTSLPELGTTLVAALHRHSDVAIGNVIGSNVVNLLVIMGLTALLTDIPVPPPFLRLDLWVMLASSVLLAHFAWRRRAIGRAFGLTFLGVYVIYVWVLFRGV
jgi:cation:H+ antiporter